MCVCVCVCILYLEFNCNVPDHCSYVFLKYMHFSSTVSYNLQDNIIHISTETPVICKTILYIPVLKHQKDLFMQL